MLLVIITAQQNSLYSETVISYLLMRFIWGFFERAKSFSKHWYIFVARVHSSQNPEGKLLDVRTMVKKFLKAYTQWVLWTHMDITQSIFHFPSVISQMPLLICSYFSYPLKISLCIFYLYFLSIALAPITGKNKCF